ncbi:hypothetical protein L9G74_18585 [Shewanella sp. C32]|uniref:Uncharacterized protein n=1 Tax=Shewanella electrica TaxID=515560 RepID=A0ABT2FQ27_9GAMM|nr:hypothetical protein [Shewanella electrica]MCH1925725.1 hypothetical protein [Shewanella electrica]MCS4558448.1 hypothetical protein [Shewanella electrica]
MDSRINRIYLIAAAIISPCLSFLLRGDSILARSICMLLVFSTLIFAALFHNEWAKNQQRDQQD